MDKFNFIRTTDEETKQNLLSQNFQLVSDDGNIATFINDTSKMLFEDNKNIEYTNMLYV